MPSGTPQSQGLRGFSMPKYPLSTLYGFDNGFWSSAQMDDRLYSKLEDCADACEHVADTVEAIVMKNS